MSEQVKLRLNEYLTQGKKIDSRKEEEATDLGMGLGLWLSKYGWQY